MAEKKYYWLKLKSDFFDDETIKYIEEQENGIKYSNFYLKLCLKSLRTEGKLIRLVGETLIPYDVNSLAKLTSVDFDTVRSAMELFEKIGLIKILDGGEIYLSQINEMIGSETDKAQIMRRLRAENKEKEVCGNNVTNVLPKCYTEIEIEIEKDNISSSNDDGPSKDELLVQDFEKIWIEYPRKEGKSQAFKKYKAWLKGKKYLGKTVKLTNEQMWYAVQKYSDTLKEKNTAYEYIKHGDTFFGDSIMEYVEGDS